MAGDTKSTLWLTKRKPLSALTLTWTALVLAAALSVAVDCGNSPMDVNLRQLYRQYHQQEQQQQQPQPQRINTIEDLTDFSHLTDKYESPTNMNVGQCNENLELKIGASPLSANAAAAAAAHQPIECSDKTKTPEDDYYVDKDNSVEKPSRNVANSDRFLQEYFGANARNAVMQTDEEALTPPAVSAQAYLPTMYYNDFYEDLVNDAKSLDAKRGRSGISCDCKVTNDLKDLGHQYFPRYLLNAVCQTRNDANTLNRKCWHGAICKPLEYKIKVLTLRNEKAHRDTNLVWLPENLRHLLRFKTVTVTAGCFCAH